MSKTHTRKSFFAKGLAALAGFSLFGGARALAKSAPSSTPAPSGEAAVQVPFSVQVDTRSVARTGDSL